MKHLILIIYLFSLGLLKAGDEKTTSESLAKLVESLEPISAKLDKKKEAVDRLISNKVLGFSFNGDDASQLQMNALQRRLELSQVRLSYLLAAISSLKLVHAANGEIRYQKASVQSVENALALREKTSAILKTSIPLEKAYRVDYSGVKPELVDGIKAVEELSDVVLEEYEKLDPALLKALQLLDQSPLDKN